MSLEAQMRGGVSVTPTASDSSLEELLALLPDNDIGAIDAADLRTIITDLWERGVDPAEIDATIAELIGTPGSETELVLSASIDASALMSMNDSFEGKANGVPTVTDSGHVYTAYQNPAAAALTVTDGKLSHSLGTSAAVRAGYLGVELDDIVGQVAAEYSFPAGVAPAESLVLIVSNSNFAEPNFADAACHFVLGATGWSYEWLEDSPFGTTVIASGKFATRLAGDTRHRVTIDFVGDHAYITLPDGSTAVAVNDKIRDYRGTFATLELYAFTGNSMLPVSVYSWGAGTEAPLAVASRAATRADVVRAVGSLPNGRLLTHTFLTTAVADIPLTTAQVEIYRSVVTPISKTGRYVITGCSWIREEVPVTATDANLYLGVYVDGNGSYGRSLLLKRGYTPANGTRYWNGTAMAGNVYQVGRLWPWQVEIDLSAFNSSQSFPLVVKAWANAANLFVFQQQGDASNADALRRNTITVFEG
jgi:hypothetical protein